ncbi:cytochrome c [Rhodoblastus sp.]|uniref:cytochrome c n=1 Tax=Rhodoblastus sp. TaxID=1962975 RepID=UPI003F953642
MSRRLLTFLIWTDLAMASGATAQAPQKLVTPPEVDLPFGDANFPDGLGVEAITNNCVACHSADHVMNQPSLSKECWEEVVKKMVRAYKAPISPVDQEKIVDYLASIKGLE